MPPSEQFTAAGKAILNSVYQICAEHEVPKSEIPDLLLQLADSVIVGQMQNETPLQVVPSPKQKRFRITPEMHAQICKLNSDGVPGYQIAKQLGLAHRTVYRHLGR